jgi:hypothetical protein
MTFSELTMWFLVLVVSQRLLVVAVRVWVCQMVPSRRMLLQVWASLYRFNILVKTVGYRSYKVINNVFAVSLLLQAEQGYMASRIAQ